MKKRYFIGIDIGTYESKGVIIDGAGEIIASASEKHGMENPRPNYYEHDAEQVWWGDFCKISRRLLETSGIPASGIAAVGASTLSTDCLPVDRDCRPLRKAILYGIDARSQQEIAWMTDYYGEARVKELFGRPICSGDVAAKILWIKNNEPEIHAKTHKFLTGSSYLAAKLTGNFTIDRFLGIASFRPFYREDGSIREELCEPYCRPDQLAQGKAVTELAGRVTAQAAEQTGLAEGTPVIVGTGDSAAEAISTGVLEPGDVMVQFGSSVFLYCCTDRLVTDDRVRGNSFVIPGMFSIAAGTNNSGTIQSWFRDRLYGDAAAQEQAGGENAFDRMLREAEQIPVGSDGLITLPYFAGERTPINDPDAKGVFFGMTLRHTRAHLYRSALEGIGFSVAQHIDILKEHDLKLNRIMAVGGGTKNRAWMQMVADILGEPVRMAQVTIGACYGDALMAAIGAGDVAGFPALAQIIRPAVTLLPDPETHRAYQPFRQIYDELYLATKELMHRL